MLVVMTLVRRVPTPVVHVVDMVAMWNRDVAAAVAMHMVMTLVHRVLIDFTLVKMPVVRRV